MHEVQENLLDFQFIRGNMGGKKDVEEIVVQTIDNEAPMQHYDLLPKVIKV